MEQEIQKSLEKETDGGIKSLNEFEKSLEQSGQRPSTYKPRIDRLRKLEENLWQDPLPVMYQLYREWLSVATINNRFNVYKSRSSLERLFFTLWWKAFSNIDGLKITTREPLRQESFTQTMFKKTQRETHKFRKELNSIIEDNQNIPIQIFDCEKYESLKVNIKRFLYLLEIWAWITKDSVIRACSETETASTYYLTVLSQIVTWVCQEYNLQEIPLISDGSLRAWVKKNLT